jgi:uncharacterized protein
MKTDNIEHDNNYNLESLAQGMRNTKNFNYERVASLIELLTDVNVQVDDGYTLLMHAVNSYRFDVVKLLIEKGSDPNIRNDDDGFALEFAAGNGYVEMYDYLYPLTETTLREEASIGLEEGIRRRKIIEKESVFKEFDSFVKQGNVEAVRRMVTAGFDIDEYRTAGTAFGEHLYWCITSGDFTPAITLIASGSDLNLANKVTGGTYLQGAVAITSNEIEKFIVGLGFNDFYRENGLRFIKLLIDSGADINAHSESLGKNGGATALMSAAESGDIQIVRMLLEAGTDPLLKDNKGLTALDYAKDSYYIKKSGDKELIPLLKSLQIPSEPAT